MTYRTVLVCFPVDVQARRSAAGVAVKASELPFVQGLDAAAGVVALRPKGKRQGAPRPEGVAVKASEL